MKELDKVLKAFTDINRLRIIKLLEKKKMCVCEIAFIIGIAQPSVSRHLRKLKSAGIINFEQEGLFTNYYLKPDNKYAEKILKHVEDWLRNEDVVKKDSKKIKKADRQKLFNR